MTNDTWKTVRVPPDAYERAQEQRQAADRTWGEQIVRPEEGTHWELKGEPTEDELRRIRERIDEVDPGDEVKLVDDMDEIKSSVETVEERTGRIERQLEQMGAGR